MTPNLGQGGAQSLEDAATLAICLDHLLTEPPGLVSTDRLRRALRRMAAALQEDAPAPFLDVV